MAVDRTNLLFSFYVVSGTLSFVGSSLILMLIFQDRKTRQLDKRNNYMIMAALSFFDLILSFVLGYGWNFYPDGEHPWAQGNYNTCMGHTFLMTLGLASTYYNGSLAVYYVLVVKFAKKAEWMLKWAMPSLVGLPAIYAVTMTATCLSLGSYGFDGKFCGWCGWVDDNDALGWAASWGPICFSFVLVILCMAVLVHAIYVNEKKMRDRYNFATRSIRATMTTNNNRSSSVLGRIKDSVIRRSSSATMDARNNNDQIAKLKMTRKMAIQAMWYIGAFFITYVWSAVASFIKGFGTGEVPFFVWVLRALFQPSQGLLNFIVFYRGYSKGNGNNRGSRNSSRVSSTSKRVSSVFKRVGRSLARSNKDNKEDISTKKSMTKTSNDEMAAVVPDLEENVDVTLSSSNYATTTTTSNVSPPPAAETAAGEPNNVVVEDPAGSSTLQSFQFSGLAQSRDSERQSCKINPAMN